MSDRVFERANHQARSSAHWCTVATARRTDRWCTNDACWRSGLSVQIQTRRHTVQALSDVALSVGHGEVVGLVGESGGGKTMIARSIIAALPRGARVSGTVRLEGREVLGLSGRELMEHRGGGAALCFQNPRRALAPIRTIGNQLADRLAVHRGLDGAAARAEALRLLRDVGLRNPEQRYGAYPHELSGGMSQRVMIAAALACRPRLLLADEPTTGLDVTLTRDILELFRAVADEQDRGVLLVSHDIAAIAEFCDRLVVLYAGSVVEDGPTGEVLARPAHPYTRTLLDAVPELDGGPVVATGGSMPLLATVPTSCPFAPRCARAADDCRAERPLLTAAGDGRDVACFHPLAESTRTVSMVSHPARPVPAADAPVVRVRDLHVEFRGRLGAKAHHVLHGVDLTVARGETIGVVGESGSGKTTLARVLMGLVPPSAGSVEVGGIDIAEARRGERRRFHATAQMVFQDPVGSLSPRRTAGQAIREPMSAIGLPAAEQDRRLAQLVGRVGLDPSILGRRPAPAVRRPGPARRHRPRPVGGPHRRRVRRAHLGPRRDGAGADPRAGGRVGGERRPHVRVHLPRSRRGPLDVRPRRRALPRPHRRARHRRRAVRPSRCTPTRGRCSPARRTSTAGGRPPKASASPASSTTTTTSAPAARCGRAARSPPTCAPRSHRWRPARRAAWSPAGAPTRSTPAPPCPSPPAPPPPFPDHREDRRDARRPVPALRRHRRHVRRCDGARPAHPAGPLPQGVDHARRAVARRARRRRRPRHRPHPGRAVHPRDDARPQRRARTPRRRHRHPHQRGDARHLPHRSRQHPVEPHVRLHLRPAAAARGAAPHHRRARPARPPRPGDRAARRRRA